MNASLEHFPSLSSARDKSDRIIDAVKKATEKFHGSGVCLAITGSLARREVTDHSDFDCYIITTGVAEPHMAKQLWQAAHSASGLKDPSAGGSFGYDSVARIDDIAKNIGGNDDTNRTISQRILILLESEFVGDGTTSDELLTSILTRYISDDTTNHQLGMFMLNDIIRFYRTMCVDFEYKTVEAKKSWAIRNLKLVFSRKLIYFAGLIMCAELAQARPQMKRQKCREFIRMTPIDRVLKVLGDESHQAIGIYDEFLAKLADPTFRNAIANVKSSERSQSPDYTDLKNLSHHFTWALRSAFNRHYDTTHPIHKAIMF